MGRLEKALVTMAPKTLLLLGAGVATYAVVSAAGCGNDASLIPAIAVRQEMCPASAPFFGFMGCAAALVFACKFRRAFEPIFPGLTPIS